MEPDWATPGASAAGAPAGDAEMQAVNTGSANAAVR